MYIHYINEKPCGNRMGNGSKIPFLERVLYRLYERDGKNSPFDMRDILHIINFTGSFGRQLDAPLPIVTWLSKENRYDSWSGWKNLYAPRNIHFTDGQKDFYVVLIGGAYELRVVDRAIEISKQEDLYLHKPVIYFEDRQRIQVSFEALLKFIKPE